LNDRQIQAVAYIREQGKITHSEFQILASVKKRQATKDLNDLKRTSGYFPGREDRKRDPLYFQRGTKGE
jgi:predicted DNA-binding transcriptional regulator YafY